MKIDAHSLLIFDGACGTNIQNMALPDSVWGNNEGCNEYLNISAPEAVVDLHSSFVDAGAMVIETNTFGATGIVLGEYGLQDQVREINEAAVAHARKAIGSRENVYVAGSLGPTTKLPSLGHITYDAMLASYAEQLDALLGAGVDLLIIETCQDLLQVKIALVAAMNAMEQRSLDLPLMVSLTFERTGTMLVGTDVAAAVAALEPFPLFALGLNCATGPADMESKVRYLSRNWPHRISCIPNQGLPEVVDGKTFYPLSPDEYTAYMREFIADWGVSIVGGCCGTTPEHIRGLVNALQGVTPAVRDTTGRIPAVASLYQSSELVQDIRPLVIGERTNANGSRLFRDRLLADDYQGCLDIGLQQEASGAHVLDVCAAYAGRDEKTDMTKLVELFASSVKIPLVIDSTTPEVIEECLKLYPGRCIINSINLEDGGTNIRKVCALLKKYGAAVIALTINEGGMAMTADEKVATACEIHRIATEEFGLRPQDILFDPLTFTVGAGDETLRDAAIQTLNAIRRIKDELPGVLTVLGLSNISFGLAPQSRRILNSVFLHEAVEAGLDAAIIDAGKILPLARISEEDREISMDLLYDRVGETHEETPLMRFIQHFDQCTVDEGKDSDSDDTRLPQQVLFDMVENGEKEGLEDELTILLQRITALGIINQILVPAMRHVGELFGKGEILLPFVLKSAEVMKTAVTFLEPHMEKIEAGTATKVLLATVQGDVHDIGKNLVEIILSNNGYKVYNIGIKVPAETIIQKAQEHDVDLIGLSGLLVKSAIVMQESMPQYEEAGLKAPILLGGAALTEKFVAESCVPSYGAPVVYCPDAFAGLKAVQEFEEGRLKPTAVSTQSSGTQMKPGIKNVEIERNNTVPTPPFIGHRHVTDIDPSVLFEYMNEQALFRGRWGYRRGKMSADEYKQLIDNEVLPLYEEFKRRAIEDGIVKAAVAYGYFPCWSKGNTVYVRDGETVHAFPFPRQAEPPHLCIADFYKTEEEGGDVAGFFVVTIGEEIDRATHALYDSDQYHDYLMLHGFSVEVTDALAEYWHEVMRKELGFAENAPESLLGYAVQEYRGSRYGFGYPACPELEAQRPVFAMLKPEELGISLTETLEMVPEQTTSAIVAHHPQAKYFAV